MIRTGRIGQTFWKLKRPEKMVISFQAEYLCKHITGRSYSVKNKFSPLAHPSEPLFGSGGLIHASEIYFDFAIFLLPRRRQHSKCRRRGFAASNSFGVYLTKKSLFPRVSGQWLRGQLSICHCFLFCVVANMNNFSLSSYARKHQRGRKLCEKSIFVAHQEQTERPNNNRNTVVHHRTHYRSS